MITENMDYVLKVLEELVNTPSPSGFCQEIVALVEGYMATLDIQCKRTNKGNLIVTIPGKTEETLLLTAHLDTLGGMVRSIKQDGKIRFTSVGSFMMHSVEGSYCKVHKRDGTMVSGTILSTMPSVHVYEEARTQERKEAAMEIRLDIETSSKDETVAEGIQVGDFISFDPKFVIDQSGYIKSRHLDDKAGVAVILGALSYLVNNQIGLEKTLKIMFSTYEEVGHGSSYIPENVTTLLAIDMGAIGDDLSCSEKEVSICAKDSSGPYDYQLVGILQNIAKEQGLSYSTDIYPYYGSDASAALRGGHDIRAALIGPGIHGSHGMERTHKDALLHTMNLLIGFLQDQ